MKRGRSIQQSKKKSLKRTPLTRSGELKRVPFKRSRDSRFVKMPVAHRAPHARFRKNVLAAGVCVVCGEGPKGTLGKGKRLDPHHVVPKRYIKRYVSSLRLSAEAAESLLIRLLYDERDGMCVCRDCHQKHEGAQRRFLRSEIPASAIEFAETLGLDWVLDLFYPEAT